MRLNLDLEQLFSIVPSLTRRFLDYAADCCVACLIDQIHPNPVSMAVVHGSDLHSLDITHSVAIDEQFDNTYRDESDRLDYGATAVAPFLVEPLFGYEAVSRSRKGNKYDYWLRPADDSLPFGPKLEISGIQDANQGNSLDNRIQTKIREIWQHARDHTLEYPEHPFYIVVVDFGEPRAKAVAYVHSA